MTAFAKTVAAISGALLLLLVGVWWGGHPESLPGPLRDAFVDDDRALRAELVDSIHDSFYKPVKRSEIDQGSLKGIVNGLGDQFSQYLTPAETREFRQTVAGELEGVGLSVEEDRRGLSVLRAFDDSPADRAGIKPGELVIEVNGKSIAGVPSQVATGRIKGPAGTRVKLKVADPETGRTRTLDLKREKIEVPAAEGRTVSRGGRDYGVVEFTTFSEGAHGALRAEINEQLEKDVDGLVLDLRGNGGGLLSEAVLVSSIFIEDGLVTYTKGRTQPRRDFDAEGNAIDEDLPLVVLVDGGSASASEIVTGAMRDRKRATIVGTRTFGKGVYQEVQPLSNGGVLDITVGQYFLPKGENIQEKGVRPTVRAVDDPDTDRDEALPKALSTLGGLASR
ncbi:MAG TPA: S41 family peptidase [Thermoleophilaceae bacterium]|nr:S41 family peptidase [Thermoleophilaceae bacterium]